MDTKKDNLFIGKAKVIWYNSSEGDTKYTLDDGSSGTVTDEQFSAMAKTSRYEDKMAQVYKWNQAVSEIVEILLKNKMMLIEKDFVSGRVDSTIVENYGKAAAILFGAPMEEFIKLSDIDRVLKENPMSDEQEIVTEEVAAEEVVAPVEEAPVAEEAPASEESAE